jgi:hypothetical protein
VAVGRPPQAPPPPFRSFADVYGRKTSGAYITRVVLAFLAVLEPYLKAIIAEYVGCGKGILSCDDTVKITKYVNHAEVAALRGMTLDGVLVKGDFSSTFAATGTVAQLEQLKQRMVEAGETRPDGTADIMAVYVDCNCCDGRGGGRDNTLLAKAAGVPTSLDIFHWQHRWEDGINDNCPLTQAFYSAMASAVLVPDAQNLAEVCAALRLPWKGKPSTFATMLVSELAAHAVRLGKQHGVLTQHTPPPDVMRENILRVIEHRTASRRRRGRWRDDGLV